MVVPRIVVLDADDAAVFSSVETAQTWLEPWYVETEPVCVFDDLGQPYTPRVDGLKVKLDSGGQSVDLDDVCARLGAPPNTPLIDAIDDYLRRHPKQKVR